MESIAKSALSLLIVYSTHYASIKVYNHVCMADGVWGYFQGIFTTGSPICQGMTQVMAHTQTSYSSIILMGLTRSFIDILPSLSQSSQKS